MAKKKTLRSILFLLIGIALFWWVFRGTDLGELGNELARVNWFWVSLSLLLNLFSQFVRAIRWKILFRPMDYNPRLSNLFLANIILAFTNQIIPRGGEIARLGVVNKTDRVPFAKLFGTALVERLTEFVILMLIFITLVVWQFDRFQQILQLPEISAKNLDPGRILLIAGIGVAVVAGTWLAVKKFGLLDKIRDRLQQIKKDIGEGFTSILRIRNKLLYFVLSISVYGIWFVMLYLLFFALPATAHLSFAAAAFTFGLSTLAFLLPIQAGMGAWHFVVIQCLLLFGVDTESGKAFSLIAHAATNLVHIVFGTIAFGILALIYRKNQHPAS